MNSEKYGLPAISAVVAVVLSGSLALAPVVAQAQQRGVTSSQTGVEPTAGGQATEDAVKSFWTPDRLSHAQPLDLKSAVVPQTAAPAAAATQPRTSQPGAAPTITTPQAQILIPQSVVPQANGVQPDKTDGSHGTFTTSRVFPDSAAAVYPYRAAGQLFFHDPRTNGNFVCSASVVRARLVATAGHCVTSPSTAAASRYFYTNFLFVPGLENGAGPVGSFTSSIQWVSNIWYLSNGSVPNAGDWGMLVITDRSGSKISAFTGYLGYITNSLSSNNLTIVGYPCNLDSCNKMEYTNASTAGAGGSNTYTYGSAMRGGVSGGPWIQDFGVAPASNPVVSGLGNNYLAGVTSYGPVATNLYYLGASQFDSNWLSLLTSACGAASTGNC